MYGLHAIVLGAAFTYLQAYALPANGFLEARASGSCTGGDIEPVQYLGGYTNAICESTWGTTYSPVTSLTLWGGSDFVTGIQVAYADGTSSQVYGNTAGRTAVSIGFNYAQNNNVHSLTLYGNANGPYLRHVRVENAAGTVINSGYPNPVAAGYSTFPQNVGSGILYGFKGSTDGTNINGLGFLFLDSPVHGVDVSHFTFTNPPQGDTDINPTDIDQYHAYNGQASANYTWAYNNQKTRTVTRTFQQSTTNTFTSGASASASLGIMATALTPGISFGGGTSFSWTTTSVYQTTIMAATAKQIQYNSGGTLAPGKGVDVLFIAGEGSGTFPYTSNVTLSLANGHQYSFQESGNLILDDISDTITDIYEDDNP